MAATMMMASALGGVPNATRSIFVPPPYPKIENPHNLPEWKYGKDGELTEFRVAAKFICYARDRKNADRKYRNWLRSNERGRS